jgi:hypothetical protein
MQIITTLDFLLLPLYLAIFYFFIKKRAVTYADPEIRKIFFTAFFLRMFGSVTYCLLIQYYYGFGDSFTFYQGSSFIHDELVRNLSNIKYLFASSYEFQQWFNTEVGDMNLSGYLGITSSNAVMKISALISFIAFNKYIIISLFFGLFSFAGQWKLFQVFNNHNKGENQKLLAYAVLYSPSIWFWGSALMKDSICIGAVGFIISILYKNMIKRQINLKELLILPLLIYLVFTIKSYIIIILIASIIVVFFVRYIFLLKNVFVRFVAIFLFLTIGGVIVSFLDFSSQINDLVEESYSQVISFQKNYENLQNLDENSKAGFEISNFDASLSSMLIKSPGIIFSCLFRPFLWESKKIIIVFTSIESTILLLGTLYLLFRTRAVAFFRIIFSDYLILFCFILSIFFALIIGFTTFNFGTMTRYKIMLLPFYYFMLVGIYNKSTEKQLN